MIKWTNTVYLVILVQWQCTTPRFDLIVHYVNVIFWAWFLNEKMAIMCLFSCSISFTPNRLVIFNFSPWKRPRSSYQNSDPNQSELYMVSTNSNIPQMVPIDHFSLQLGSFVPIEHFPNFSLIFKMFKNPNYTIVQSMQLKFIIIVYMLNST